MLAVGVIASPRKDGNTSALVEAALQEVAKAGWETETIYLEDADIHPCRGCMACKDDGKCVQEDGMSRVYEAFRKADAVILGSPVYFATMSGQMKVMVDRLIALIDSDFRPRIETGKRALLLFAQGDPDTSNYEYGLKPLAVTCEWLGMEVVGQHVVGGVETPGEVRGRDEEMGRVRELARRLTE